VLNRRLSPVVAGHLAYPTFPRRNVPGDKPARLEARLRGLQLYLVEMLRLLAQQTPLQEHVDELDVFLALSEHIGSIKFALLQQKEIEAQVLRAVGEPLESRWRAVGSRRGRTGGERRGCRGEGRGFRGAVEGSVCFWLLVVGCWLLPMCCVLGG
jgi:hypothetical protein